MSSFPGSPRILKGGIVQIDVTSGRPTAIIPLQYNSDSISRTLQAQGMGDHAERSEALRLKGPAIETIRVEAELDLTDTLETATAGATAISYGLHPQIAALESLIQPRSDDLQTNNLLASIGTLEIAPMETPLSVFVWSRSRVLPVRITDFSLTEEAFDTALNPIRAKLTLAMRVLTVSDLGFTHRGGGLFMAYLRDRERLARLVPAAALSTLGVEGLF